MNKGNDFFNQMMFGKREEKEKAEEKEVKDEQKDPDSIDYNHVMNQIGKIMNSLDEIKPALKEFAPLFNSIKKKIGK
ncbi:hypothetical protein JOC74_000105 [Bacillus capparidis]|uniref:Spore coat protein n=2 Tax=Bacillus capparidis TaxID=1840411 RepID=A0ABS4CS56_9BACI|nr:hypothetical protein [Bacillus capparidis]